MKTRTPRSGRHLWLVPKPPAHALKATSVARTRRCESNWFTAAITVLFSSRSLTAELAGVPRATTDPDYYDIFDY